MPEFLKTFTTRIVWKGANMTYKEWAEEYFESARNLKSQISELKEEMKTVTADKLAELTNRINIMTTMYYECMDTARLLARRKGEC